MSFAASAVSDGQVLYWLMIGGLIALSIFVIGIMIGYSLGRDSAVVDAVKGALRTVVQPPKMAPVYDLGVYRGKPTGTVYTSGAKNHRDSGATREIRALPVRPESDGLASVAEVSRW